MLIGMIYGWTSCTVICLPFISFYIIGSEKGVMRGIRTTMIFNIGRIFAYSVLGMIVGFIGQAVIGNTLYNLYGTLAFSFIIIMIGMSIFLKRDKKNCSNTLTKHPKLLKRLPENRDLKALVLGLFISLIPCAGLVSVLSLSAISFSPINGALAGLLFGIGSSLSPLILIGAGAGWFSKKINSQAPSMKNVVRKTSGVLLFIIGIYMIVRIG